MKSLDSLNEEYYTLITNKMKNIFVEAVNDGSLDNIHVKFSSLNDEDLKYSLETFISTMTDPKFLGELDCAILHSKYSSCELEHPVFKQLMSMSFFTSRDLDC